MLLCCLNTILRWPACGAEQNMFAVHGDLAHVKVVYDRSTGKSMGYGFVKFTTNEAAAAATVAINGMAIDRKRIKVRGESIGGMRGDLWAWRSVTGWGGGGKGVRELKVGVNIGLSCSGFIVLRISLMNRIVLSLKKIQISGWCINGLRQGRIAFAGTRHHTTAP